jgi:hypothetical protein
MNYQSALYKSETIALAKRNDYSMRNNDIKAVTLSINDLLNKQHLLVDTSPLKNLVVNGDVAFVASAFEKREDQTTA